MDKEFLECQFDIIDNMCSKAKQLLFFHLATDYEQKISFFMVHEIDSYVTRLSPIEQILYISLKLYEIENKIFTIPFFDCQYQIKCNEKTYKADFFIDTVTIYEWNKDFEREVPVEVNLKKPLVIECDGFDFHSSKKQLNNDYKRENDLKLAGYDVIRFTGSQIYTEPMQCVKTLYDYIDTKIKNKELEEI